LSFDFHFPIAYSYSSFSSLFSFRRTLFSVTTAFVSGGPGTVR
jgi:hypothetical protein